MEKNDFIEAIEKLLIDPTMWEYNCHMNFFYLLNSTNSCKVDKHLFKSMILMKLGELKKAEKYLEQCLLENSQNIAANAFLGNIYNKFKKSTLAKEFLSKAANNQEKYILDILGSAISLSRYNNIEESLLKLTEFIKNSEINTTILHVATEYGLVNIINHIINQYIEDINSQDFLGWTALHWAAWLNEFNIIPILIKNGANLDTKGKNNETPLYLAAFKGNNEAVKLLLDNNANIELKTIFGNAPLHMASYNENIEVISIMLNYGADIDIKTDVRHNSPLHVAAWHGKIKSAIYLLNNGCNINAKTVNGCTPLHRAALNGKTSMIKLLIDRGIELNILDKLGRTPLYCAYKNEHWECYNILLKIEKNLSKEMSL